ncbi:MAG TPA: hypothetical protein VG052_06990 [Puia sp.]|jgi:hypothetical protein|nr:hypothetical protein [Puia sp.]
MRKVMISLVLFGFLSVRSFAQSVPNPPAAYTSFPYTKAYVSFIIPWVTVNKNETTTEFQSNTTIGFPVGLNVYYSKSFGFSYEITPSVEWNQPTGKEGMSKTSNLLIDPGPIFRFPNNFNIIPRLAFETQGRYGFTPVFNKVYCRTKAVDYWFSVSFPARFGNNAPASVGASLQIGFTFN